MHAVRREPDWARVPPHVPTYPNPPAFFRQKPAEYYTQQIPIDKSYQRSWTKWQPDHPEYKAHDEHFRLDPRAPMMRKREFETGVMKPAHQMATTKPDWRAEYHVQGVPITEATRARGINRLQKDLQDRNLYAFSNAMLSTQYKKPVPGIYSHLLREPVYGLKTSNNRHGFMPKTDYYF